MPKTDLVKPQQGFLDVPGCHFSSTGLEIAPGLSYENWEKLGGVLRHIHGAVQWWWGDWYAFGERSYGELSSQATKELTGYESGTLRNLVYVSSNVELSSRNDNLSWKHHYAVASLYPNEQVELLTKAAKKDWTYQELRTKVRQFKTRKALPATSETCTIEDLYRLIESGKKFKTIYADPPWKYGNQSTRAATDNHYDTMTIDDISALPINELADDESHLHLWTTTSFRFDCLEIIRAWGFEYKSEIIWCKPQIGIGNYVRVSHETLLICTRGGLTGQATDVKSWLVHDRTKHSEKPEEFRKLVESISPSPRLELFGRRVADGWTVWGNEIKRTMFDSEVVAA